jgi:hypothetical protein
MINPDQVLLEVIQSASIGELLAIPGVRGLVTKYYQGCANQRIEELRNPDPTIEKAKQDWITEYVRINPDQAINCCEQVAPGIYFLRHEEDQWVSFLYFTDRTVQHAYRLDQISSPHREIYTRWARGKDYKLHPGRGENITYLD